MERSINLSSEIKSLGGRFMDWPDDGLHIRKPEGPPKGLRLSQDCSACCIVDHFLENASVVNDGVSYEGHLKADAFIQGMLVPVAPGVEVEKVYKWCDAGFSGMDAVIDPSGDGINRHGEPGYEYQCHVEIKTSSDINPKPKGYNRSQVIRQRVVMAREYGIDPSEMMPSVIFIIAKSGMKTNWVYGPFLIEPTAEELDDAEMQIDLRIAVYEDIMEDGMHPLDHPLMRKMRKNGTCTRCFPLERIEPTEDIEAVFKNGRKDWDDWIEYQRLDKWVKSIKDKVKPLVAAGKSMETDYFLIRSTESGRLYVDPRNLR